MARQKGTANFSGTLEVLAGGPIDSRTVVPTLADLTVASNFPYAYVGMETYVVAENKKYRLIGDDVTQSSNWEEVGSGGGGIEVDDEIDEESTNPVQNAVIAEALDAKQDTADKMTASDMDDVVTPLPSVMSRRFKYSTEEQVVGEWIDGKPLYQKTLNIDNLSTGTNSIAHNIANLKKAFVVSGYFTYGDGSSSISLPYMDENSGSNSFISVGSINRTNLVIYVGSNYSAFSSSTLQACVTVQYTKTTD